MWKFDVWSWQPRVDSAVLSSSDRDANFSSLKITVTMREILEDSEKSEAMEWGAACPSQTVHIFTDSPEGSFVLVRKF